ncbi:MAG: AraC family transcriptional regulator [Lachnospiraceae bacterium]
MTEYSPLLTSGPSDWNRLFLATNIPVSVFRGRELVKRYASAPDYSLPMILLSGLARELPPVWIANTPEDLYFAGTCLPGDLLLFFGPTLPYECTREKAASLLAVFGRKRTDLSGMRSYFLLHAQGNVSSLRALAELASRLFAGSSQETVSVPYQADQSFLPVLPAGAERDNYQSMEIENALLSGIRRGDVDAISRLTSDTIRPLALSQMPDPDLYEAYETGAIALASRAAIEGGVDYAQVVEYRARFTRQLASARDDTDAGALFIRAFLTFARLVQRVRQAPGSGALSRKVVRYVQARLYEKTPVSRIAEDLHVNVSYLCTQFRRETGRTISTYVQEAKTEEAKFLLEDTALRTLEISELLCFSSVNYFTRVFREHTGMTPARYRQNVREGAETEHSEKTRQPE